MKEEKKESIEETIDRRIRVLERSAAISQSRAMRLRQEKETACGIAPEGRKMEPCERKKELEVVLGNIDAALKWRYVDETGRVRVDEDALAMCVSARELRVARECIVHALEGLG